MLFLSIDTSGKSGGITLAEGDEGAFRIIESAPVVGGTFSAQLVPALAAMLQRHGFAPLDLQGLVAISGPGSFTGLRVGLSAVKGLAEVLKKQIATVSLLEALAVCSGRQGRIAAVLDAGRSEVYFGLYQVLPGRGSKIKEEVLSHGDVIEAVRRENPAYIVSSDPSAIELLLTAGIAAHQVLRPGSEAAARLGLQKLMVGQTVSVEELDVNYIRRSDAEIFRR
jgi:tRNA threonylcarbamoyladenosine biosynthesis protein TsaB